MVFERKSQSRNKTIEKHCVFKAFPQKVLKTHCVFIAFLQKVLKHIVFSLLFEIVAAVDKEPGEPGEVVDGGTKK